MIERHRLTMLIFGLLIVVVIAALLMPQLALVGLAAVYCLLTWLMGVFMAAWRLHELPQQAWGQRLMYIGVAVFAPLTIPVLLVAYWIVGDPTGFRASDSTPPKD